MFGVDTGELFIIVLIAVLVIGPKDLPRVMSSIGHWVGKARGMANQFRSGVDQMMRESEIADLEKKWREQNEAIMRANPLTGDSDWGVSDPPPAAPAAPAPVSFAKEEAAPPAPAAPVPAASPTGRPQPPAMAPLPIKPAATPPRGSEAA